MHQKITARTLLVVSSLFALAGLVSYIGAKFVLPSLFPYWGIALIAILGGWAATSTWVLLTNAGRTIRWLVVVVLVAAGVAGGMIPWIGLAALLLVLLAALFLSSTTLLLVLLGLWQRHLKPSLLLLGFVPMLAGVMMLVIANLIRPAPPALPTSAMSVTDRNNSPNYTNVDEFFASLGLRNDGYSVAIGGMGHGNFSDLPLLSPLLLANGFPPEELELGSIDPLLGMQVANAYNRAFFDRYLKNINSPLLQGSLPDGMNQEDITFVKVTPATSVPEPATTVTIFGFAGLGLLTMKRKKTC